MEQQQQPPRAGHPQPSHDEPRSCYELRLDGQVVGQAKYRREGDRVVFTHTEVDSAHEGKGLASRLAAYALDDVRRRGLKAVPQCSFITRYLARHEKEYGDLLER